MNGKRSSGQFELVKLALGALAIGWLLSCGQLSLAQASEPSEDEEGFAPLFDGKSLEGWVVVGPAKDAFEVKDGIIECNRPGGEWLRTKKQYEDFVLRLEYKISPGGNSGIFIRSTRYGNPAFTGMEIQILEDAGKEPDKQSSGALYASVAPSQNASKPAGEWNSVEITCVKRRVAVLLNGVLLYDINLDEYRIPLEGRTPLKDRVTKGYIGFQDYGNPVWFRNIRIKEIHEEPQRVAESETAEIP